MSEIVVLGSLNADLVVSVRKAPNGGETVTGDRFAVFNGGKGANQAYAVARTGGRVSMLGRVGNDGYGQELLLGLAKVGVDITCVRCIEDVGTGVAVITVEEGGENRIVVVPGANGQYGALEFMRDAFAFEGASLALFQLETPMETVAAGLRAARANRCVTILDPAPAQRLAGEVLLNVDYLTPNRSELSLLSGYDLDEGSSDLEVLQAARALVERGVRKVLAKLGSRGALLVDRENAVKVGPFAVDAIDTTAAGDCFNGAFASGLARGLDELSAARFACAAAALSVTRSGAQVSVPDLAEVEAFLAERA